MTTADQRLAKALNALEAHNETYKNKITAFSQAVDTANNHRIAAESARTAAETASKQAVDISLGQIADKSIVTAKLADGAVNTAKLADSAVTTTKIVDGAVSLAKLADNAKSTSLPIGAVLWFTSTTLPQGFLQCNGSTISRTAYDKLFAIIGTIYGSGNGSNTFALPDLRGVFIRGLDNGRGFDSGRSLGGLQYDALGRHRHNLTGGWVNAERYPNQGWHSVPTGSSSEYLPNHAFEYLLTTYVGGSETRPKNVALFPIIRAF